MRGLRGVEVIAPLVVQVNSRLPVCYVPRIIPLAPDLFVQAAAGRVIAERKIRIRLLPATLSAADLRPLSASLPMKYTWPLSLTSAPRDHWGALTASVLFGGRFVFGKLG